MSHVTLAFLVGGSMCHNLELVRLPVRTVSSSQVIVTVDCVKCASQPASQSCPTDRSEWFLRAGTICTRRAAGGKPGMSSSAVWLDCMRVPLGLAMVIGVVARCLLATGIVGVTKCAVQPESAIKFMEVLAGGPGRLVLLHEGQVGKAVNALFSVLSCCGCPGFPRPYSLGSFFLGARGPPAILLLPPLRSKMVASLLWLSPLFLQVALVWSLFLVTPCVWQ
jgi:hypothetical protein